MGVPFVGSYQGLVQKSLPFVLTVGSPPQEEQFVQIRKHIDPFYEVAEDRTCCKPRMRK